METGYKAFHRSILERVHLVSDRFGFEPEFTVKVAKVGFRTAEVPFPKVVPTQRGKKITGKKTALPPSGGSSNFHQKNNRTAVASSPLSIKAFDVILYQPEILRTPATSSGSAPILGPPIASRETAGRWEDKQLCVAGPDHHEFATLTVHETWEICLNRFADRRLFAVSTRGQRYDLVRYAEGDVYVRSGKPWLAAEIPRSVCDQQRICVPMVPGSRSLNLSTWWRLFCMRLWRVSSLKGPVGRQEQRPG